MNRYCLLALSVAALVACGTRQQSGGAAESGASAPLHAHSAAEETTRTAIGQVQSIDKAAGTVSILLGKDSAGTAVRRAHVVTLSATPELRAQIQIGEVVEFRSIASATGSRMLSINAHAHRQPAGLPDEIAPR
ncbi:hypothetical protein [Cognatilysobacter terrigena]|uniref:hypothetical protein n=1 Tax=Cognatilysobacter terrigena TaxID=2488749 RepID=UPI00105DB5F6|nr:hypothetical protein [Lysobacter terrigena]